MPSVYCPRCDAKVKVPSDYDRSSIRCSSCDKKIPLDEEEDEKPSRPVKKKKKKSNNDLLAYLPLLLIFPLLTCPCLAYAHRAGGPAGAIFGLIVFLTAVIKIYVTIKRNNLADWDDLPFFLRGGAALLYYQIKYSVAMPKEIGIWFVLEILGIVIMIASGTIGEGQAALEAKRRQDEFVQNMQKGQPNANNVPAGADDAAVDRAVASIANTDFREARKGAEYLSKVTPNAKRAQVAQQLAARVPHPDVFTNEEMVKALARWATPNEVPTLIGVVEAKKAMARVQAIEALGNLKDERALLPLVRAYRDGALEREPATKALQQFGPAAEKTALSVLNEKKGWEPDIIRLLGIIGTKESLPTLTPLTSSKDLRVRNVARESVAAINQRGN